MGDFAIDDFVKLAAGLLAAIFVLYIAYIFAANYASTECWRQTIKPFDESFLGTRNIFSDLGTKDTFKVSLNFGSEKDGKKCLQAIFFVRGEYREYYCSKKCEAGVNNPWWRGSDTHKSEVVQACKEECTKSCSSSDCIILMPRPTFLQSTVMALNKPRVYGSGSHGFVWDSKWDKEPIGPDSKLKCLIFTRQTDGKTYRMEPTEDGAKC